MSATKGRSPWGSPFSRRLGSPRRARDKGGVGVPTPPQPPSHRAPPQHVCSGSATGGAPSALAGRSTSTDEPKAIDAELIRHIVPRDRSAESSSGILGVHGVSACRSAINEGGSLADGEGHHEQAALIAELETALMEQMFETSTAQLQLHLLHGELRRSEAEGDAWREHCEVLAEGLLLATGDGDRLDEQLLVPRAHHASARARARVHEGGQAQSALNSLSTPDSSEASHRTAVRKRAASAGRPRTSGGGWADGSERGLRAAGAGVTPTQPVGQPAPQHRRGPAGASEMGVGSGTAIAIVRTAAMPGNEARLARYCATLRALERRTTAADTLARAQHVPAALGGEGHTASRALPDADPFDSPVRTPGGRRQASSGGADWFGPFSEGVAAVLGLGERAHVQSGWGSAPPVNHFEPLAVGDGVYQVRRELAYLAASGDAELELHRPQTPKAGGWGGHGYEGSQNARGGAATPGWTPSPQAYAHRRRQEHGDHQYAA